MGVTMNKKADLTLSINAIVILILAVTLVALGLWFASGRFYDTFNPSTDICTKNQTITEQPIPRMTQEQAYAFYEKEGNRMLNTNDLVDIDDELLKTIQQEMNDWFFLSR